MHVFVQPESPSRRGANLCVPRDVVYTTQQSLPGTLHLFFQETIRPEIIKILQNTLASGGYNQIPNPGMSSELYQSLLLRINDLKQIVDNSKATQIRLESCLSSEGLIARYAKLTQSLEEPEPAFTDGQRTEISRRSHHAVTEAHGEKVREPLSEV